MIAWERSRVASAYGKIWGTRVTTIMVEITVECYGVDCSNTTEVIERRKSESANLREADVPGAILPREIPEECTVKQLQRWLLCRGAKTTGKKMQLEIGRAHV